MAPADDLTVRAAKLLQTETGTRLGADIVVHKRIPMGAGLGGGSSDCAAVLVALNELWDLKLSHEALGEIGLRLGADVPVFIGGRAAWAEGVGEVLTPVEVLESWYLVIVPGCHVSTAEVFGAPALTRNSAPTKMFDFLGGDGSAAYRVMGLAALLKSTRNDCEEFVRSQFAEVDEAMGWLAELATARLTGTGAAIFAPAACEEQARMWREGVPEAWQGFVARGLNESPLLHRSAGLRGDD